eukprot:gnl/MRDRNA2_/MRDRNA2_76242_c0_seq1.p1 gnl/MRDRNA2_/MRDRNA2_76242_c0~~gnl/MRDRNA2_/MRDRNA2_76242_c0_seq1.p1  ORF type:complete len:866 (-),score=136.02 gnl/MRDRNA2_/MRDRNA2_76242_c0_seq1:32-2629(-)
MDASYTPILPADENGNGSLQDSNNQQGTSKSIAEKKPAPLQDLASVGSTPWLMYFKVGFRTWVLLIGLPGAAQLLWFLYWKWSRGGGALSYRPAKFTPVAAILANVVVVSLVLFVGWILYQYLQDGDTKRSPFLRDIWKFLFGDFASKRKSVSRWYHVKTNIRWKVVGVALLLALALPWVMWAPPLVFWMHTKFLYHRCEQLCWQLKDPPDPDTSWADVAKLRKGGVNVTFDYGDYEQHLTLSKKERKAYLQLCDNIHFFRKLQRRHWNENPSFLQHPRYSFAKSGVEHVYAQCLGVLSYPEPSHYTRAMIERKLSFFAFESLSRLYYKIGLAEVYGAFFWGHVVIALAAIVLVMNQKWHTVQKAKFRYLIDHVIDTRESAGLDLKDHFLKRLNRFLGILDALEFVRVGSKFEELDKRTQRFAERHERSKNLNNMEGNEVQTDKEPEETWEASMLLYLRAHIMDVNALSEQEQVDQMYEEAWQYFNMWNNEIKDRNAAGVGLGASQAADMAAIFGLNMATLSGLAFAIGPVFIPVVMRRLSNLLNVPGVNVRRYWLATPGYAKVLLLDAVISALANFMLWMAMQRCLIQYSENYARLMAFDALWRFPGDNPMLRIGRKDQRLETWLRHSGANAIDTIPHIPLADFTKSHPELWPELLHLEGKVSGAVSSRYCIQDWLTTREFMQLDFIDERVDMELHIVMGILTLLPKAGVVMANLAVVAKGAEQKMQSSNIVALWELAFLFFVVVHCVQVCMSMNNSWDLHGKNLIALTRHVELESEAVPPEEAKDGWLGLENSIRARGPDGKRPANNLMAALYGVFEMRDSPSKLFGFKVGKAMLGTAVSVALTSVVPQLMLLLSATSSAILK